MKYSPFLPKSKNESGLSTDISWAGFDLLVSRAKKEHAFQEFF
jgi:hypothetical protein